jgi:hypothetical protein
MDLSLSDEAREMMPECPNTLAFLNRLCDEEQFHDAFITLARALPRQYAIIWAERCFSSYPADGFSPEDRNCIEIVRQWLKNPSDSMRQAAMDAAESLEFGTACAWLGAAVGFSGGSMTPPDAPEVMPPEHMTAVAIAAGLSLLTVTDTETIVESSRRMVNDGIAMVAIPGG